MSDKRGLMSQSNDFREDERKVRGYLEDLIEGYKKQKIEAPPRGDMELNGCKIFFLILKR